MASDALILDGHLKSAVAAARSLARQDVRVICGARHWTAPALHSHACEETFRYPDPLADLEGFLETIRVIAGDKPMVLFTFSDRTTLTVSRNRERLPPNLKLLMPSAPRVELCFDKERLVYMARNLAIQVPETLPGTEENLEALGLPVVLKPRFNVFWNPERGSVAHVAIARNRQSALRALRELRECTGESPLAQRHVAGSEFGITALCRNGTTVAAVAHRRLRSLSPDGGASVVKETIPLPDGPYAAAVRLLEHLQWIGPAMVEFRGDPYGEFYLIEVNGRFWGSLPLQIVAGVDFPVLAMALAQGTDIGEHRARTGVISRHLLGDAGWLVRSLARGRLKAIGTFLGAFSPRIHEDMWDAEDPAPFFWDIIRALIGRT